MRGALENPVVNGRASLASLTVNGRDVGALTATVESDAAATRIPDGLLVARDGGRAKFDLTVPRSGTNNITLNAALERYDLGTIIAAAQRRNEFIDDDAGQVAAQLAGVGPTSGSLRVTGLPGAASGSADLKAGPGQIRGEPFDEIIARATFDGSAVQLDTLDARFRSGRVTAKGRLGLGVLSPQLSTNTTFDLQAEGANVRLDVIETLFGGGRLPRLAGTADFKAVAAGDTRDPRSYRVTLDGEGRGVAVNGQSAGALKLVGRTEARSRRGATSTPRAKGSTSRPCAARPPSRSSSSRSRTSRSRPKTRSSSGSRRRRSRSTGRDSRGRTPTSSSAARPRSARAAGRTSPWTAT
ncbi:MAG: hypothetical protein LC800_03205 [Acidobacteria bacterium]|nr:hypothetical protein [Acidobacteriota bacterium]